MEGEYLITLGKVKSPFIPGLDFTYVGSKPMHDEIAAVNALFDEEMRSANTLMAIALAVTIAFILLVIFLLLNRLIRKRITEPIDRLSGSAEKVMRGDLDVEIGVHDKGEFAGIEYAFREMVRSFRIHIARSVGEEDRGYTEPEEGAGVAGQAVKRPRLLYEITAIIVAVMLVYGIATFFIIRSAQEKLIDKSIDRVAETEAENFFSGMDYAIHVAAPEYQEEFKDEDLAQLAADMSAKRVSHLQAEVSDDIRGMIEKGIFDMKAGILVLPPLRPSCRRR